MGLLLAAMGTSLESFSNAAPREKAWGVSGKDSVCWAAKNKRWAKFETGLSLGPQGFSVDCKWNKKDLILWANDV